MTVAAEERAIVAETAPARRRWRLDPDARAGLTLISPTFGYALLLLAAPLALVIAMSFWTQDFIDLDTTFTTINYEKAWGEPIYQTLLLRSLWVSGVVTIATVLLAFPIAYYISFHVKKNKALWLFLITIPFWTSYLLRVFLWKVILGYEGVVNSSLLAMGFIDTPLTSINYSINAVVLTLAHAWAPFAILPIFIALEKIDRSFLEAAEDLGDGPVRRFVRVTLPLAMPGVIAAMLIVFIPTIGDYVTPKLLGGSDGLMIANMIEVQFKKANDAPLGAALAITAMLTVLAVIFGVKFLSKFLKWANTIAIGPAISKMMRTLNLAPAGTARIGAPARRRTMARGSNPALAAYAIIFLLFLYGPVTLLPIFAFNDAAIIAFPLSGFTTKWFDQLWNTPALHGALVNSAIVGSASAILATCLGIFAARASSRFDFPAKKPMIGFIMLPLVLPEIIIAVALLVVLIQLGLELSLWTVILGHVLICTPFAIAILTTAFNNLDRSLEEASLDLGETRVGTFRRVTLPLVMPGIISSLLISFTISLDEFIIAFFLTGTEPTLPVYIWGQLRFTSKLPGVIALGFLLLLLSLVLLTLGEYFRRRAQRRTGIAQSTGGLM